jgi:oligoribonuclease
MEIMTEKSDNNLIWIDMEMSGLNVEEDKILEVAVIVTDPDLKVIAEGPVLVVHQEDNILDKMDAWNTSTHNKTGLVDKVKKSKLNESMVENQVIDFLKKYVNKNTSPMCGNSICQDRRFMAKHMPNLENFFHYRNLDVSVFKELAKRWKPELIEGFKKAGKHEALADIIESIEELKYYREHFIKL